MRVANYFCIRMAETDDEIQSDIYIMLKWAQSSHNVMDVINTNFYIEDRSIFMAGEMYVFVYYVDTSIKAIYLKSLYARFCS